MWTLCASMFSTNPAAGWKRNIANRPRASIQPLLVIHRTGSCSFASLSSLFSPGLLLLWLWKTWGRACGTRWARIAGRRALFSARLLSYSAFGGAKPGTRARPIMVGILLGDRSCMAPSLSFFRELLDDSTISLYNSPKGGAQAWAR